jgi:hypothetical protein
MRRQEIDLFKTGTDVYKEVVSPEYDTLRTQLNDQLAAGHLRDLRERTRGETANFDLIANIASHLPACRDNVVIVGDPYQVRQVQSKVFWPEPNSIPRYILGQRQSPRPHDIHKRIPIIELLTCAALSPGETLSPKKLGFYSVWSDEWHIARQQAGLAEGRTVPTEEIEQRYDEDSGNLRVYPTPQGLYGRHCDEITLTRVMKSRVNKVVTTQGVYVQKGRTYDKPRVSDSIFAAFDVPTHLNNLAVAFGVSDVLDNELEVMRSEVELPNRAAPGRADIEPDQL